MSAFAEAEDVESIGQTVKEMTAAVHAQTQVLQDLAQAMNRQHVESARATGGRVEMHVSAGGVGLWVAVTVAIVCGVLTLACAAMFVNLDRKVDRAIDYQTAAYMMAPKRNPEETPK